jgi:hypothetical protein
MMPSVDDRSPRAAAGSGKWLAAGIVVLGVVLALLAMKFRQDPDLKPTTVPSTLPIAQDPREQSAQR